MDNDYKIKRENIDSYYMQMAYLTSTRSTCIRRKVGCVIVRDNMILSSGYNGMPKHLSHCSKHTCIRLINNIPSGQQPNKCLGAHSEMNAISQAAYNGISIKNSFIYCTTFPCIYCAKALINAGITDIFYCEGYSNEEDKKLVDYILQNINIHHMIKKDNIFIEI